MNLSFCRIEFKPQDLWIGVYWKKTYCQTDDGKKLFSTDVWICIIPMFPLHLSFFHTPIIKL